MSSRILSGILGVGVDIVQISRIQAVAMRRGYDRLANRILSETEKNDWNSLTDTYLRNRFLAVRWAVKEAAYKALYPAFRPSWGYLTFRSLYGAHSKPSLVFTDRNANPPILAPVKLHASVSHDAGFVVAYVLAESDSKL
ncbi:4'-phosphopantetheinyl transferase superfamily [Cantharellus anzutake]|uniref:4'-phosphopantetheinyl transferase superfamily n=1 Tax=Cantharellus anzutake TaxID=1750568 RepID=UPI001906BF02|nr:4'-phosphopantetheinyl transferase superfamily [Cantharellus anzutake]KAF8342015.1 4'-phosphopantetheinyl transferase superfamily [Cantharellus anzutake]